MLPVMTLDTLKWEAREFSVMETNHLEPALYGVTDGKAVGTYFEHKFQQHLHAKYQYVEGSSAKGIDFPGLNVDMKVTSVKQPQSSCPFKSARQKVYGLGYSLLVFVYEKADDAIKKTGNLKVLHTVFVESAKTADFQTTSGLRGIIDNSGNIDDILAFLEERLLPVDDIMANDLAQEILTNPPEIGFLTISNALQWRLQYSRVIDQAGRIPGIIRVL